MSAAQDIRIAPMGIHERIGRLVGRVLSGVTAGLRPLAEPPKPPAEERVYRVSIVPEEGLTAAMVDEREVRAPSPESAAERRVASLAEQLYAAGKHRNRTFEARVHGKNGPPHFNESVLVGVSIYIKTEAIGTGQ